MIPPDSQPILLSAPYIHTDRAVLRASLVAPAIGLNDTPQKPASCQQNYAHPEPVTSDLNAIVGEVWPFCTSHKFKNDDDANSRNSNGVLHEKIVSGNVFGDSRLWACRLHRQGQGSGR
jgi:hypothetical protein